MSAFMTSLLLSIYLAVEAWSCASLDAHADVHRDYTAYVVLASLVVLALSAWTVERLARAARDRSLASVGGRALGGVLPLAYGAYKAAPTALVAAVAARVEESLFWIGEVGWPYPPTRAAIAVGIKAAMAVGLGLAMAASVRPAAVAGRALAQAPGLHLLVGVAAHAALAALFYSPAYLPVAALANLAVCVHWAWAVVPRLVRVHLAFPVRELKRMEAEPPPPAPVSLQERNRLLDDAEERFAGPFRVVGVFAALCTLPATTHLAIAVLLKRSVHSGACLKARSLLGLAATPHALPGLASDWLTTSDLIEVAAWALFWLNACWAVVAIYSAVAAIPGKRAKGALTPVEEK